MEPVHPRPSGPDPRFEGSRIPDPGFPGDSGEADPALAATLAAWERGEASYGDALAAVRDARLLVPVVAVVDEAEVDADGLAHDKTSDMATVLLTGRDGRTALLGFTGTAPLQAWQADARPVPVTAPTAALAAVQDGADALVVDLAGPVRFVVEGDDLTALAAGWQPGRVGERTVWIRPAGE